MNERHDVQDGSRDEPGNAGPLQALCRRIVASPRFEAVIIGLILVNAAVLGLETSSVLYARYGEWMLLVNHVVLAAFIVEAVLKFAALWPRPLRYFASGWNVFDFSVIVLSLVPAAGPFAMIARMARLMRVVRLVSAVPELRVIVATLLRSLPGLGNVVLLLAMVFYVYAVAGYHLLHEHDPEHWSTLGLALLTLFRVLTLEDWTDVMYTAMDMNPLMWIYFVSFVVVATFIVINMFIAVVISNLEEAKREGAVQTPRDREELLGDLREARLRLEHVERELSARRRRDSRS